MSCSADVEHVIQSFLPRWCFILTRKLWACRLLRTFLQCMQRTEETQVPAFKLAAGRPEAMSDELSSTTRWFWRFEPSESPGIRAQVAKLCTWNPTKAQDLQWITDASFHEAEAAGRRPGMVGPKDACRSNHAWPASQECCTALPAGPQSHVGPESRLCETVLSAKKPFALQLFSTQSAKTYVPRKPSNFPPNLGFASLASWLF